MNTEASMRSPRRLSLGSSAVTVAMGMALASPGFAQHVHGVIDLGVVLEGDSLAVSLHAPLSDVVGFERAAENDDEAARLREAAALLADADRMFGLPDGAGCTLQDLNLVGPDYLLPDQHGDEHEAEHAHGDDHHEGHDDHDDSGADHDGDHSDEHADEHSEGHSHGDLDAQYVWQCTSPSEISALATRFVTGFANVETIKIQLITPAGVRVLEGDSQLDSIAVSDP